MAAFVWGAGGRQLTPDQVEAEKKVANALMLKGMDYSPVQHWSQGVGRVAQALMGGLDYSLADAAGKRNTAADKDIMTQLLAGGAAPSPTAPSASPAPASAPPAPQRAMIDPATITSPQSAPVKDVYDSNEQSPLDPVPGAITPDRAKLLAAVYQGESGGRPNVMYGGKTFDSYADHPRQPQPIMSGPNAGNVSTAAGAPQFIAPTWDRAQKALGLTDFSPGNQNAGAAWLAGDDYQKRTGGDLDAALAQAGGDPAKLQAVARALAPTWTSLPGGIEANSGGAQFVKNMQPQAPGLTDVSAQAVRSQPGAAPAPAAAGPNTAAIIGALTNPAASDATKKVATMLLQQRMQGDSIQTVDLGNAVGIMDKRGNLVKQIPKGQKPGDAPTVQRIKQADGSEVAVQWDDATGEWKPLKAPEGGNPVANPKLTEQQSKDVGFFNRGQKLLPRLEQQDKALTDFASATGGQVSNYFKTDSYRQAEQTGRELLAVILRKDTGAAVTPSEMSLYGNIYMPQPGDDMATIQQKRVARQTAIEGLKMGLGTAQIIFNSREALEAAKTPAAGTAPAGQRSIDDIVKQYTR